MQHKNTSVIIPTREDPLDEKKETSCHSASENEADVT